MVRRQEALLAGRADARPRRPRGSSSCDWDTLDEEDRAYLHEVFDRLILPVVTPLTVDPSHPFPYISNLSLNVGVEVRNRSDDTSRFARVKVPPNVARLLPLPGGDRFIPLEQILVAFLDELFPGMDVGEPCVFRVTRDADLALDDDAADDLLLALQEELRRRRFLPVVRLEIDSRTSEGPVERLTEELGLGPDDVYRFAGPLGSRLPVGHPRPRPARAPRRAVDPAGPAGLHLGGAGGGRRASSRSSIARTCWSTIPTTRFRPRSRS